MRKLDQGYVAEVDLIDKNCWDSLLLEFEDASYYQTWSFGAIHSGEKSMSRLILKKNGKIVGMAQLRIISAARLPIGIAFLSSGPIYRPKKEEYKPEHLHNLLRALRIEYVIRRRYFLRIVPNKVDLGVDIFARYIFEEEGYSRCNSRTQTVIVDLSRSLDEIRRTMDRKWRQTLQSAEKNNLEVVEGNSDEIAWMAMKVFREMKIRKGFFGGNQYEPIKVHLELPEKLKLRLAVCVENNEPIAVLGWATIGTVGVPIIAATGDKALKKKASYVLWWKMIGYYKEQGFLAVDMGGVNKKRNPGGYYFKTHILGKRVDEQPQYLGSFDACNNIFSWILFAAMQSLRGLFKHLQSRM